jgi:hypothetical protein
VHWEVEILNQFCGIHHNDEDVSEICGNGQ